MPVVNGKTVVVCAGTHSGPVTVESVCVSVPTLVVVAVFPVTEVGGGLAVETPSVVVGGVPMVIGVAIDGPVVPVVSVVGVGATAVPPVRFTAAPQAAAVPVFVTMMSVTTSVTPAGTVNASTAVAPAGTALVISTTFWTAGRVAVASAGDVLVVCAPS
jgi:hypothetical protein